MSHQHTIRFAFPHGLGDACSLSHALPLWLKRDYRIAVKVIPFLRPLIEAAGASCCDEAEQIHPWFHPLTAPLPFTPWSGNKIAANLRNDPLPDIGTPAELWGELLAVRLRLSESTLPMPEWSKRRPLIVTHLKGSSGLLAKNLPDHTIADIWRGLISSRTMRDGIIVNLNEERQSPLFADYRVRNLSVADEQGWGLVELVALLNMADLVVGIDSGPLHLCRLTDAPALGLWTGHQPHAFALPREKTRHLCAVPPGLPYAVMEAYGLLPLPSGQLSGELVARVALGMIERKEPDDDDGTYAATATTVQAEDSPRGSPPGTDQA